MFYIMTKGFIIILLGLIMYAADAFCQQYNHLQHTNPLYFHTYYTTHLYSIGADNIVSDLGIYLTSDYEIKSERRVFLGDMRYIKVSFNLTPSINNDMRSIRLSSGSKYIAQTTIIGSASVATVTSRHINSGGNPFGDKTIEDVENNLEPGTNTNVPIDNPPILFMVMLIVSYIVFKWRNRRLQNSHNDCH